MPLMESSEFKLDFTLPKINLVSPLLHSKMVRKNLQVGNEKDPESNQKWNYIMYFISILLETFERLKNMKNLWPRVLNIDKYSEQNEHFIKLDHYILCQGGNVSEYDCNFLSRFPYNLIINQKQKKKKKTILTQ